MPEAPTLSYNVLPPNDSDESLHKPASFKSINGTGSPNSDPFEVEKKAYNTGLSSEYFYNPRPQQDK